MPPATLPRLTHPLNRPSARLEILVSAVRIRLEPPLESRSYSGNGVGRGIGCNGFVTGNANLWGVLGLELGGSAGIVGDELAGKERCRRSMDSFAAGGGGAGAGVDGTCPENG